MDYLKKTKAVICLIAALISLLAAREMAKAAPPAGTNQTDSTAQAQSSLDFEIYRTRIEPILLKTREGGVRCYDCHSVMVTRLHLERLPEGNSAWTEQQSRQHFKVVSQLVTPAEPLKSRLLLDPLSPEAGGDPTHTGGKFWKSQDDPEWRMIADWVSKGFPSQQQIPPALKKDALDFDVFKSKVEPIFLKPRPSHARCYSCHSQPGRPFYLEPMPPGTTIWTEEQSRRNFQSALQEVVPGDPIASRLLMHPLAPEAGGDPFHSGGRQFESQNDPDWLVIAQWIIGAADPKPLSKSAPIYVTNSAGDTIDVIDSATNKVVQVIHGIELPHGIAFSPEGARVYISNESENVLDVVDRVSGTILQTVPLSGRPNNLAITKDGGRVLVGIRSEPGVVDVIETTSLKRLKSIPVDGGVHNVYTTPDGKYAVSGSLESKAATVIDLQSDQAVWEVKFDRPVRPMAFETDSDGSTRRIFVQLSRLNGLEVVDFAKL